MPYFKGKMHQFDFGWGSASDRAAGAYSSPPDSLAGFKGPTSKGERRDGEGKGDQGQGKGEGLEKDGKGEREGGGEGVRKGGKGREDREGKKGRRKLDLGYSPLKI